MRNAIMASSTIFPKNEHMKVGMYVLATIGVWPLKFEDYPRLRKLYYLWSNFLYYYFLSFVLRQFVELFRLMGSGNIHRTMQNCSLTLLTAISAVRSGAVRGERIQSLTEIIIRLENKIMACRNEDIKGIYKYNVKISQMASAFFIFVGTVTATPFYFGPLAEQHAYPEQYVPDNITGIIKRRLPLSEWIPYDYTDHYLITFLWQVFDGWTAECFVVYTDAFLFGMMIFPVGQLQLLQHIFRNFRHFALDTQTVMDCDYKSASYATVRACILYHKDVIEYISILDASLQMLMLLDFASCSIQMSVLVFQVIMSDMNVPMIFAFEFLLAMVIQLFLFYWNANEITVESLNVANAIWAGGWYEETEEVKYCMRIVMMRAQQPLVLKVGPFYPMSTETALTILKATYSYAMLLRQSYIRKLQ